MFRHWSCVVLLMVLCPCLVWGQDGRLEEIRQEANGSDGTSSDGKSKKGSDNSGKTVDLGDALPEFSLAEMIAELSLHGFFAAYPYAEDYPTTYGMTAYPTEALTRALTPIWTSCVPGPCV